MAMQKARAAFQMAQLVHRRKLQPYKDLDMLATAYARLARDFQMHIARVELAIRCNEDLACFAASFRVTPDEAARHVQPYLEGVSGWSMEDKRELMAAAADRAALELGKRAPQAQEHLAAVIDQVATEHDALRQSILFALSKIAKLPCAACVEKLDLAVKAGEGKKALAALTRETALLRSYFVQAGGT
jgi:hypothetical protein